MPESVLNFENVINARDIGGLRAFENRRVQKNHLFRGAQLSKMSDNDRALMSTKNIELIVDFRYKGERERQKTQLSPDFNPDILVIDADLDQKDTNTLAPHERFMLNDITDEHHSRAYMLESYENRPNQPAYVDLARRSLKTLAKTGCNAYFHCAAGKDRTGTFVATLLLALGCTREEVIDEYMRTAELAELRLFVEMAAKKLEDHYGRVYEVEALWPFFGVERAYIERSLDVIGDIDQYLGETLGLSDQERVQLITHYVG